MVKYVIAPIDQRTADGIVFDSKGEMRRYLDLKLMQRAGKIFHLTLQPQFKVEIGGSHFCTYTADFSYFKDGSPFVTIEDVKTSWTQKDAAYRLRKKAAELFHGVVITEVDSSGKEFKKGRKTKTKVKLKKFD